IFRPGGTTWIRSCVYTAHGDLVAVHDTKGQTKYVYDAAHRLKEETIPGKPPRRFGIDASGNLLTQPGLAHAALERDNRLSEANGERRVHDDRDRLSVRKGPRGTTRYEYDDLDRLVKVIADGSEWTGSYDVYSRLVQKTWQGRTTTYYWDDFRLAAEVRDD